MPAAVETESADLVVLLADDGSVVGSADRVGVHGHDTPLHLAFSSYLFDGQGRLLLTRRALGKATWPGVWSNSACGHPRPGEPVEEAVRRRVSEELGAPPHQLRVALPDYRYRAVDVSGVVEHEICPVFLGRIDATDLRPDPAEIAEVTWVPWAEVVRIARTAPRLLSPWAAEQILLLEQSGTLD
nr:isopentenyl-diphosphate Delta-isomerase [Kineosphaera limosa]